MEMTAHWKASLRVWSGVSMDVEWASRFFQDLGVGRVESGDLGVELRESCGERGVGCGGGRDADGHQKREELAAVADGVDVELEFDGMESGGAPDRERGCRARRRGW